VIHINVRKRVDCIGICLTQTRVVDLAHDDRRLVSNHLVKAEVPIGLDWRYIENAIPEAAECDRGVADVGLVRTRSGLADVVDI